MAKTKDDKEITVVAEFEVSNAEGSETIKGFCTSWQRLRELQVPAKASFVGWARIDKK